MLSSVGRPREHDEHTATALLDAAERAVQDGGLQALSVRALATEVGTTTRAVYSLFGSKAGLVVALGARAYDLLRIGVETLPITDDPVGDLIEAGLVFRRLAIEHPALFTIGVQRVLPTSDLWPQFRDSATAALAALHARIARLADAGVLGERSVDEAAFQFHSLCEGMASVELRAAQPNPRAAHLWRGGLSALVHGFALPA
jgi:AcrR family transcriptional regulator